MTVGEETITCGVKKRRGTSGKEPTGFETICSAMIPYTEVGKEGRRRRREGESRNQPKTFSLEREKKRG